MIFYIHNVNTHFFSTRIIFIGNIKGNGTSNLIILNIIIQVIIVTIIGDIRKTETSIIITLNRRYRLFLLPILILSESLSTLLKNDLYFSVFLKFLIWLLGIPILTVKCMLICLIPFTIGFNFLLQLIPILKLTSFDFSYQNFLVSDKMYPTIVWLQKPR